MKVLIVKSVKHWNVCNSNIRFLSCKMQQVLETDNHNYFVIDIGLANDSSGTYY